MLHIASDTQPGYGENQDAMVVLRHPRDPRLLLAAVADGQGGQPGGKAAAHQACQAIVQAASKCWPGTLLWARSWKRLLAQTDRALRADADAGFTTLVAFAIMRGRLCGVACGDSALLAVTRRDVRVLTEGQMKNPPLGSGQAQAFTFKFALPPPWTILTMTDGAWKFAGWNQVWEYALETSDPEAMIEGIRCAALQPGGSLQDDFTLLVVQEDGKPQP
ncbi:SpoIIE family protein phosphatase [Pseudomaricurvus alcaniphilus]|uniref:PP2C family protein-serine/threonine phosphatase n=1 Tax=Pseudomaricurvus alcaniphilus TaxID=1166482 RepID=UPI00140CF329|nr:SpoIIE family protein phosphatase [Pseudomaricurvus alcaniphilus]NHN36374.1 SpoIIE family protein phosphatase [Pseudomaricurvus alcaniphilus]